MTCQNCGQSSWVRIGAKQYCTHCGSLASMPTMTTSAFTPSGPASAHVVDLRSANATAHNLHGGSAVVGNGVLDLRTVKPKPAVPKSMAAPRPVAPSTPAPAPAPQPVAAPAPEPSIFDAPRAEPAATSTLSEPLHFASPAAEQQRATRRTSKPLAAGAASLAVLIMAGYIWLANYSTLSVRTAGNKAGIVASLPHYVPNDYSLQGPISYGSGFISFNLRSKGDGGNAIAITQRKSNWNPSSLFELYVSPRDTKAVAVESQGLKIYLYDHHATWVNRGLQYIVEANAQISNDELVKLATSL